MGTNKDNLMVWNHSKSVPKEAIKEIKGGRLKGMSDIRPQWRLKILTEMFGVCGFGWKYKTVKEWTETHNGTVSSHVIIELFVKIDDVWSDAIEGQGGSMLVSKESSGLYHSDEAYKMATTDAISVACKQLGIGADVYMGYSDSKYNTDKKQNGSYKPLDFKEIQSKLNIFTCNEPLDNYGKELKKLYPNMTTAQGQTIKSMFDKRRNELKYELVKDETESVAPDEIKYDNGLK